MMRGAVRWGHGDGGAGGDERLMLYSENLLGDDDTYVSGDREAEMGE